jgi:hypothetical protein
VTQKWLLETAISNLIPLGSITDWKPTRSWWKMWSQQISDWKILTTELLNI